MNWNQLYPKQQPPALPQISAFVGSNLWESLCTHLEEAYGVSPRVEHSICSGAPGWNVKYKKSSRALCTLYPAAGYFTAMVSIGAREAAEAELMLPFLTDYLQQLYQNAQPGSYGRWLMIDVTSPEILEDVKQLIALRVKKK